MSNADVMEPGVASPSVDDEFHYEVVDDRRVEIPRMGAYEVHLAFQLSTAIHRFAMANGLGQSIIEVLFRLSSKPNLQRRPDAAYISFDRWARGRRIPRGNAWDVIPDLAVEVISPTNLAEEVPTKVREYFEAGVRRVWIFFVNESLVYEYDSPRSIRVLGREDTLDGGEVIPGFQFPLSELFEAPEGPEATA